MPDPRRALGNHGEQLACRHLEALGYRLLDRNFRTRYGEIDIVARSGRFLVFCEVKSRAGRSGPTPFEPLASVGPRKQRQVRRMAAQWLDARRHSARNASGGDSIRFDAIGITLDAQGGLLALDHIENAF